MQHNVGIFWEGVVNNSDWLRRRDTQTFTDSAFIYFFPSNKLFTFSSLRSLDSINTNIFSAYFSFFAFSKCAQKKRALTGKNSIFISA
jgi:hypothetical protein